MANEIVLNETGITARMHRVGDSSFSLVAGKELKIETSPEGDDLFANTVPANKQWDVTIYLRIDEIDV